ncbi:helix-turn-helix domain-containing protein [Salsuginibacillus kocurii]|uniref:helix-turn-helix domain-containing protein n=1 Tax=Salsuginibacillus kocurii TaxID=427078 RepID=UPI00035C535F|nr:helix-turn-helix domain-containing protein [Salsuginibacillus kocurii]
MNYQWIGFNIRYYRKLRGLTQKELANGICTQAQISKIEKGEVIPLSSTIFEIAQRLCLDVNYFFDKSLYETTDYISVLMSEIRRLIRDRAYEELLQLIDKENEQLFHENDYTKQFVLWHKGICIIHVQENYPYALKVLEEALNLTYTDADLISEQEIEILNSIGIAYDLNEEYEKAEKTYEKAINSWKYVPNIDVRVKIRVLYNLSKVKKYIGDIEGSKKTAEEAIRLCIREEQLYLLGELHYQVGSCQLLEQQKAGIATIEQGIHILTAQRKEHLARMQRELLEKERVQVEGSAQT